MKQATREAIAFKMASDWLMTQKKIKIKKQQELYTEKNGGSKDRFYKIRGATTAPYEQDIEAMEQAFPGFREKMEHFLKPGAIASDNMQASKDLEELIGKIEEAIERREQSEIEVYKKLVTSLERQIETSNKYIKILEKNE